MEEIKIEEVKINKIKYKSIGKIGKIGNIEINFTKRFNWFQRFMWKKCFGMEIENINDK